jgi:hypothetical protein
MLLFLIEDFRPKAVGNSCVNVTASSTCEMVNNISGPAIIHHRSGYQSLHLLSYIRSLRIFTFLYSLQYAAYNFTPSNFVRPAYSYLPNTQYFDTRRRAVHKAVWLPDRDVWNQNRQLMDRSRPSGFRSMNPKYCVSQSNYVLSCCFISVLSTARHGRSYCTIQFDIWSFLGDSMLLFCNSVNRHRRFWRSLSVSLLL